ncbi:hypothetical protein D915_007862 [Fasciola hepatica]|uniref:Uncharacterized protein n=1 Tax=Fasciola hepatica TaxID=6192 RepID=A0A4E0RJG3_FASHE|nr:hypothetical protein D915_007862 [Fasciola hepatica]
MLTGKRVQLPASLTVLNPAEEKVTSNEYVTGLLLTLTDSHQKSRIHLKTAQRPHKEFCVQKARSALRKPGDKVFLGVVTPTTDEEVPPATEGAEVASEGPGIALQAEGPRTELLSSCESFSSASLPDAILVIPARENTNEVRVNHPLRL